jgi:hypothetical protein
MEEDIMQLRAHYLHQEVKIVDGSQEDGEFGWVVGVTGRSAEPITVLFYHRGEVKHQNYYRAVDLALTGGDWQEGKQRDQTVRCRRSRFDGLFRVIDGKGPHGVGYGTAGGAWAQYLAEFRQESGKEQSGAETGNTTAGAMDGPAAQIDGMAGTAGRGIIPDGMELEERTDQARTGERDAAEEVDRTESGGSDEVIAKN